jgi:hypothetical protein
VAGVAMMVARVWQVDDTSDLSTTMKEIDRRLAMAEEWGRTLRVLGDEPEEDEGREDNVAGGEAPLDQSPDGRYQ